MRVPCHLGDLNRGQLSMWLTKQGFGLSFGFTVLRLTVEGLCFTFPKKFLSQTPKMNPPRHVLTGSAAS